MCVSYKKQIISISFVVLLYIISHNILLFAIKEPSEPSEPTEPIFDEQELDIEESEETKNKNSIKNINDQLVNLKNKIKETITQTTDTKKDSLVDVSKNAANFSDVIDTQNETIKPEEKDQKLTKIQPVDSTSQSTWIQTVWVDTLIDYSVEDFFSKDTHFIWHTSSTARGKVQSWDLYIAEVKDVSLLDWKQNIVPVSAISNISLLFSQDFISQTYPKEGRVQIPTDILMHRINPRDKTNIHTVNVGKNMQLGSFVLKVKKLNNKTNRAVVYFVRSYFNNQGKLNFTDSKLLVVYPLHARYAQMDLVK